MKKKETPFLDFYKECVKSGRMNCKSPQEACWHRFTGLCGTRLNMDLIQEFKPTGAECIEVYWGFSGEKVNRNLTTAEDIQYAFTPLRQTIVLFCACLNGEL
jgi:hypothetical protein